MIEWNNNATKENNQYVNNVSEKIGTLLRHAATVATKPTIQAKNRATGVMAKARPNQLPSPVSNRISVKMTSTCPIATRRAAMIFDNQ